MRYALIGTAALVAFASATYACGSDSDDDAVTPTPANDAGRTSSSSSSSSGNTTSSSSSSSGASSSSSSSSGTSGTSGTPPVIADAGTVVEGGSAIPDGGGSADADPVKFDGSAGSQCLLGSVQESEPNGTDVTANVIEGKTGSFCGRIFPGNDVDLVKFTLPVDASEMSIGVQNAGVGFRLEGKVGAESFVLLGQDAGGSFPFKPGEVYTLSASSTSLSDYIIGLNIKQVTSSLCKPDSVKETEANNDEATANALPGQMSSFCGTVNTATDVDTVAFTIPAGKTAMKLGFTTTSGGPGSFKLSGTVNGKTFELPKPAGGNDIPFEVGQKYVLKLTSTVPNNSYVVNLELTP